MARYLLSAIVAGSVLVSAGLVEARTSPTHRLHATGGHHQPGAMHVPHHASFHASATHAGKFVHSNPRASQHTPTTQTGTTSNSSSSGLSSGNRDLRHDRHDLEQAKHDIHHDRSGISHERHQIGQQREEVKSDRGAVSPTARQSKRIGPTETPNN